MAPTVVCYLLDILHQKSTIHHSDLISDEIFIPSVRPTDHIFSLINLLSTQHFPLTHFKTTTMLFRLIILFSLNLLVVFSATGVTANLQLSQSPGFRAKLAKFGTAIKTKLLNGWQGASKLIMKHPKIAIGAAVTATITATTMTIKRKGRDKEAIETTIQMESGWAEHVAEYNKKFGTAYLNENHEF